MCSQTRVWLSCNHSNPHEASICAACGVALAPNPPQGLPRPGEAGQRLYSGAGIASSVLSVVSLLVMGICFAASVYADFGTGMKLYVFSNGAGALLSMVALKLGVDGLSEHQKKRFFAFFGTVLSAVTLVAIVGVWVWLSG